MKINYVITQIPRLFLQVIEMIVITLISFFYKQRDKYKNAWLFCERGTDAGDNAFWMFKYVRENHPEINAYYIINSSKANHYDKVKNLGPTIEFNSFEQKIAFVLAKKYICTHYGYVTKWNYTIYKKLFGKHKKYVFLQHGITTEDISLSVTKYVTNFDLFITSTRQEYESIITNKAYGYNKEVKLTGLARFDNLNDFKLKNQILFMPTWRSYIFPIKEQISDNEFSNSEYFKKLNSLINNKKLIYFLEENNIDFIFFPHYETQKYIKNFKTSSKKVIIARQSSYNVQDLLKESKILITDYSSVFFDFAYMKKPIIYYQFDQDIYFNYHYKKGYFNYLKDGFGPVYINEEDIVKYLIKIYKNDSKMEKKYENIVNRTFIFRDNLNCERIYNEIIKLGE